MPEQRILDFYVEQSVMTRPGPYGTLFDDLPADVAELVEIVQGLLVYEDVASGFYGFELPAERGLEKHLRTGEAIAGTSTRSRRSPVGRPCPAGRAPASRPVGSCAITLSRPVGGAAGEAAASFRCR